MTAYAASYTKTVAETVDLTLNWAHETSGDAIATSAFSVSPTGLTITPNAFTATTTTFRASGGAVLTEYVVTNRITTTAGQVFEQQLLVAIEGLLTADQLTDLQGDLGLTSEQDVFTDRDLNRFYMRAGYDEALTRVYALRALLARYSKLHRIVVGGDEANKQQIFQNVQALLTYWEKQAGAGGSRITVGKLALGLDVTSLDLGLDDVVD